MGKLLLENLTNYCNWIATIDNIKRQHILYKLGLYFAVPGLIVTYIIRRFILPVIPDIIFENSLIIISKGNVDRKSTRLNSSHVRISYAVFCLKKKNKK